MAIAIMAGLSAVFSGAYLFHCAKKRRALAAFGAALAALMGLGIGILLWTAAL